MPGFLPDNYTVPQSGGRYMKLTSGDNRFRILDSPILGNEFWQAEPKKPIRREMGKKISTEELEASDGKGIRHFWAMPVWDYKDNQVKVLELTQKTLQKAIKELAADKDWGNPRDYDISIGRTGEGKETEYSVVPKPKKVLERDAVIAWKELQTAGFDLNALFVSGDPFAPGNEIHIDDVPAPSEEDEAPVYTDEELERMALEEASE